MFLFLDCANGVSGDMLVAALIAVAPAVGVDGEVVVRQALTQAGIEPQMMHVESVLSNGVSATRFAVDDRPGFASFDELIAAVMGASLSDGVADTVVAVAKRMAAAELAVHGTDGGHLHELAGLDTAVDLIAVASLVVALGATTVVASPPALGGGIVSTAHGELAVPAPAVVELLRGLPVAGGSADSGELTTPTGAALLAELVDEWGSLPSGRLMAAGYGAGSRDVPGRLNAVRAFLIDYEELGGRHGDAAFSAAAVEGSVEHLEVLETNLDDESAELIAHAVEALRAAGALDVWLTPAVMKKGRLGQVLHILGRGADQASLMETMFRETSTFGVRVTRAERFVLDERRETVEVAGGSVSIRLGFLGGRAVTVSPEYEDCRRLAEQTGDSARALYEAAQAIARRRFGGD